jgi:hypothetical protein
VRRVNDVLTWAVELEGSYTLRGRAAEMDEKDKECKDKPGVLFSGRWVGRKERWLVGALVVMRGTGRDHQSAMPRAIVYGHNVPSPAEPLRTYPSLFHHSKSHSHSTE